MSYKASKWARVQRIHSTPKQVLMALAEFADNQVFECIPGHKTLAEVTGRSPRTIYSALRYLEEMGFISRQRRTSGRFRTSDRTELMVSDEPIYVEPYGDWLKRTSGQSRHKGQCAEAGEGRPTRNSRSSNSQLSPNQLATTARQEQSDEPSVEPSVPSDRSTDQIPQVPQTQIPRDVDVDPEPVSQDLLQELIGLIPDAPTKRLFTLQGAILSQDSVPQGLLGLNEALGEELRKRYGVL